MCLQDGPAIQRPIVLCLPSGGMGPLRRRSVHLLDACSDLRGGLIRILQGRPNSAQHVTISALADQARNRRPASADLRAVWVGDSDSRLSLLPRQTQMDLDGQFSAAPGNGSLFCCLGG